MLGEEGEIREVWDALAKDWQKHVGTDGDLNRILSSDPVLWHFAGDVAGKRVLDAGCGSGYLSRQLRDRGATVTGVDLSERMILMACKGRGGEGIEFRVDSCSTLTTLDSESFDLVVANYVLMDTPDLDAALRSFCRVLAPNGAAVVVFSHPCFLQGRGRRSSDGPYFEQQRREDPPWGHFRRNFVWFHRPLSDYWKAFRAAGFAVEEFEEPRLQPAQEHLAPTDSALQKSKTRPYSVAFKLRKQP